MKYCPTCETRFDEEIMRFCTKDGTPLIDEEKPNFITMPSESLPAGDEELDEVTVVRRNKIPVPPPRIDDDNFEEQPIRSAERIVIPTVDDRPRERVRSSVAYNPPPRPGTFKVVVLTILGTIAVLAMGIAAFMFLQKDRGAAKNNNLNQNVNANLNTGFDSNFNFNGFVTSAPSANTNTNTNLKTPTPKPTASATPSVSPTTTPSPEHSPSPSPSTNTNSATPSPRPSLPPDSRPRISPTPADGPTAHPTPRATTSPSNRPD